MSECEYIKEKIMSEYLCKKSAKCQTMFDLDIEYDSVSTKHMNIEKKKLQISKQTNK